MTIYDRRQRDVPVDVDRRKCELLQRIEVNERIIASEPTGDPIVHQMICEELLDDLVRIHEELSFLGSSK